MTTIERARSHPNLRVYLVALLASVYSLAWWTFGIRAPLRSAERASLHPVVVRGAQPEVATWYRELPPAAPPVQLPAGWIIAEQATASPVPVARPLPGSRRASPRRQARIRTRSS